MRDKLKSPYWKKALWISAFAFLGACAFASGEKEEGVGNQRYKRVSWQEQILLSTGEVIVVERSERRRPAYGGQLPFGWLFDEAWLQANLPGVGPTRWEGTVSPLVLDVTPEGEWYLLGVVMASRGEKEYKLHERTRYVAFKLFGNRWRRVPFAAFPESFQPNLLANTSRLIWKEETPSGTLVTFDMKRRVDSLSTLGNLYKSIDRSLGE